MLKLHAKICLEPKVSASTEAGVNGYRPPNSSRDIHNARSDRSNFRVCSWNINGRSLDKLHKDILGASLKGHDILAIQENWNTEHRTLELDGYRSFPLVKKDIDPKLRRGSGVLSVLVRNSIRKNISIKKQRIIFYG